MSKITFMGAGSALFARNVGAVCVPRFCAAARLRYDIDGERLQQSEAILNAINAGQGGRRDDMARFDYIDKLGYYCTGW